jgi:hypothetical protein
MKIEIRDLMDENEMLSHIFLGCIPKDTLIKLRDKYVGEKDWREESVKIPVTMKIGNISVNPKKFFDSWKEQMQELITERAKELIAEKGSEKMRTMQNKLAEYEQILESWEDEINWTVKNPLTNVNGLKENIWHLVDSFKTKNVEGFTQTEMNIILQKYPNINMKKFNAAMNGITCMMIDNEIITYHSDFVTALCCGLENRDVSSAEFD